MTSTVKSPENLSSGFPTRSDRNWDVQPKKMPRGLKFWIKEAEGFYYLCRENRGADQLHEILINSLLSATSLYIRI